MTDSIVCKYQIVWLWTATTGGKKYVLNFSLFVNVVNSKVKDSYQYIWSEIIDEDVSKMTQQVSILEGSVREKKKCSICLNITYWWLHGKWRHIMLLSGMPGFCYIGLVVSGILLIVRIKHLSLISNFAKYLPTVAMFMWKFCSIV